MSNVLFVTPVPSDRGGIGVWIKQIVNNKTLFGNFNIFNVYTFEYKNIGTKHSFFDRFVRNFFDIKRVKKEIINQIRKNKIDIIHISVTGDFSLIRDFEILKLAKKQNIKTIMHLHFGKLPIMKEKNNLKFKLFKKCYKLASSVWCLDKNSYETCNSISLKRNFVVPNFINTKEFLVEKNKRDSICFIGWVVKTKGVEELLRAWSKLNKEFVNLKLELIGPYEESYKEYLKNNFDTKNVIFSGRLEHDKVLEKLKRNKIFVLPSYSEGFPNVILEAMSFGIPTISTKVGCIPEMLSNECGLIGEPKDSDFIYSSIKDLLSNPNTYLKISENCYKKVRREYDLYKVIELYCNLWRKLINEKQ